MLSTDLTADRPGMRDMTHQWAMQHLADLERLSDPSERVLVAVSTDIPSLQASVACRQEDAESLVAMVMADGSAPLLGWDASQTQAWIRSIKRHALERMAATGEASMPEALWGIGDGMDQSILASTRPEPRADLWSRMPITPDTVAYLMGDIRTAHAQGDGSFLPQVIEALRSRDLASESYAGQADLARNLGSMTAGDHPLEACAWDPRIRLVDALSDRPGRLRMPDLDAADTASWMLPVMRSTWTDAHGALKDEYDAAHGDRRDAMIVFQTDWSPTSEVLDACDRIRSHGPGGQRMAWQILDRHLAWDETHVDRGEMRRILGWIDRDTPGEAFSMAHYAVMLALSEDLTEQRAALAMSTRPEEDDSGLLTIPDRIIAPTASIGILLSRHVRTGSGRDIWDTWSDDDREAVARMVVGAYKHAYACTPEHTDLKASDGVRSGWYRMAQGDHRYRI
jgi:hypothetical protein